MKSANDSIKLLQNSSFGPYVEIRTFPSGENAFLICNCRLNPVLSDLENTVNERLDSIKERERKNRKNGRRRLSQFLCLDKQGFWDMNKKKRLLHYSVFSPNCFLEEATRILDVVF